jgi:hypothetical protein
MNGRTVTVMLGNSPIYRALPGGSVMMPLERSERVALADTLRDTLRHLDDVTQRDATECDQP